jgi:proline dehydrogenase
MEDSTYVDRTLDLYTTLVKEFPATGVALQAYLLRTPRDVSRLMPLKPVIRLVKGAYQEPADVAFARKSDTDSAYFTLASRMLNAAHDGNCTPIFGTHDLGLIARITDLAAALSVGKQQYQIHMLYGIRDAAQRRLVEEGHVVKTLVSYGASWYRWYMRRLAERPANVLFVVKSLFG